MAETTEIEKKSLEAHVELCAERYNQLEQRFEHVDEKIVGLEKLMREVHDMVQRMTEKRTDQLISWGLGVIGLLVGTVGWLMTTYVFK
jgi:predicted  nucleic acid-binding Zn-ribbon protein